MGKKILVVDDDPVIGILVTEYLSAHGHQIEVLNNGEKCLKRLEGDLPDLLILDLIMPDMTGIDVLRKLRNSSFTRDLPIVMMSANGDTGALVGDYEVKADGYVEKPFDLKVVLEAIDRVTKR